MMLSNFSILCVSSASEKDMRNVSPSVLPARQAYYWPGDARELENVIERGVALATRSVICLEDLPLDLAIPEVGQSREVGEPMPLPLKEARERFEQAYVLRALKREDWNCGYGSWGGRRSSVPTQVPLTRADAGKEGG